LQFIWHYIDVIEKGVTFLAHPVLFMRLAFAWCDAAKLDYCFFLFSLFSRVAIFSQVQPHQKTQYMTAVDYNVGLNDSRDNG